LQGKQGTRQDSVSSTVYYAFTVKIGYKYLLFYDGFLLCYNFFNFLDVFDFDLYNFDVVIIVNSPEFETPGNWLCLFIG